jgi:O-antigen/teichoic acid export membrane protein
VISLFVLAGVPITIGLATFSSTLIVTIFGPDYRDSAPVLVVLSLAIVPMFLNFQFSQTLAACDRQWWWAAALAGACLLNPVLNVICVPLAEHAWHNAAMGAAGAWLITELVEVAYGFVLLPAIVFSRDMVRIVLGAGLAGAAQLGTIWLLGTLWLPLGEAAGAGVFCAVALVLGTVPRDDLQLFLDMGLRFLRSRDVAVAAPGAE